MPWEIVSDYATKAAKVGTALEETSNQNNLLLKRQETKKEKEREETYKHFAKIAQQIKGTICYLDGEEAAVSIASTDSRNSDVKIAINQSYAKEAQFFWNNQRRRLCIKRNGRASDVANFRIVSSEDLLEIERDGIEKHFVLLQMHFQDDSLEILKIENEKICFLENEIIRRCRACFVFSHVDFAHYVAEFYSQHKNQMKRPPICFYKFYGWTKTENGLMYLHNGLKNVQAPLTLNPNRQKAREFLTCFWKTSAEQGKLATLLLYSLWAYAAVFYEECKIGGCRSVLYLSAPTGTGKTSLAKIVAGVLLDQGEKKCMRFEDTLASLEESLFNMRDNLALVDDFYAQGNRLDDQEFKKKASSITRIVGDFMIKGKMGANRKPMPDRKYQGGVIVTGEYIDLNTHSSYLRCLILKFSAGSIFMDENFNKLQKNPDIAQAFFSLWIIWLQENQQKILDGLPELHEKNLSLCRNKFSKEYPRLLSNIATLLDICHFFRSFSQDFQFGVNYKAMCKMVLDESQEQFVFLHSLSPEEVIVNALNEAVDNGMLDIASGESLFREQQFDGFFDGDYLYIITGRFDDVAEKFASKKNFGLKINAELKEKLIQKCILVKQGCSGNIKYSKDREVIPKRPRLYKIRRGVLKNG